jgi:hypothetical protein
MRSDTYGAHPSKVVWLADVRTIPRPKPPK